MPYNVVVWSNSAVACPHLLPSWAFQLTSEAAHHSDGPIETYVGGWQWQSVASQNGCDLAVTRRFQRHLQVCAPLRDHLQLVLVRYCSLGCTLMCITLRQPLQKEQPLMHPNIIKIAHDHCFFYNAAQHVAARYKASVLHQAIGLPLLTHQNGVNGPIKLICPGRNVKTAISDLSFCQCFLAASCFKAFGINRLGTN